MMGNIGYWAVKEAELIAAFRRKFVDGYVVVLNDPAETAGRPLVTYNIFDMARAATCFLADIGHRRFGYIAGTFRESSRSQSRYKGFRE